MDWWRRQETLTKVVVLAMAVLVLAVVGGGLLFTRSAGGKDSPPGTPKQVAVLSSSTTQGAPVSATSPTTAPAPTTTVPDWLEKQREAKTGAAGQTVTTEALLSTGFTRAELSWTQDLRTTSAIVLRNLDVVTATFAYITVASSSDLIALDEAESAIQDQWHIWESRQTPSERFAPAHADWMGGIQATHDAMDHYKAGWRSRDPAEARAALDDLENATLLQGQCVQHRRDLNAGA